MVSFGLEKFAGKYGSLQPNHFVDMAALAGDKSDNIPGVAGIGSVNAIRLITEYGSLEKLLQNIDKVQADHIQEALIKNTDIANLSKNLVMLRCDLPFYMVPFATEDLEFKYPEVSIVLGHLNLLYASLPLLQFYVHRCPSFNGQHQSPSKDYQGNTKASQ